MKLILKYLRSIAITASNVRTYTPEPSRRFNIIDYYDDDDDDDAESTIPLNEITSQIPPSIAITPESDEFIKSSVEDLVPILSESEDTPGSDSEGDLPSCDDFSPINIPEGKSVTFSNPRFDSNDDFTSSDDESLSDEDVPEENFKIYSNPLFEFDDQYIYSDVNPLFDEMLEDIKNKDSYVSNLDELALFVTPLSDANEDEYFDPGGKIDEIDALLDIDVSMNIENGYHDLEGDIIYLESLLIDETIPNLPPKEFLDYDPRSLKDEHDNDDLITEDKVFDPGIHEKKISPTYVSLPFKDRHYISLTYVIRIFLPYFTYPVESPFLLSSGSEDTIFDPGISAFHFSSLEPVASHRSGTFILQKGRGSPGRNKTPGPWSARIPMWQLFKGPGGHIARECPRPKRLQDSDYFKDKMLLMQAQENGAVLDEEQSLFLAGEQIINFDEDVDNSPENDLALNMDHIFEADECDAFDSDVDEDEYHEVHEMQTDEQHNYVVDSDADYTSNSNIIPYDQYVEDNEDHVVQRNVSSVRNDALMSILDEMHEQGVQSRLANKPDMIINDSVTSELARYKELVGEYEKRAKFELTDRERKIDEQMRIIISDRNRKETSLKSELHSAQILLSSTVGHYKSKTEEVIILKKDFKQKEDKFLEEFCRNIKKKAETSVLKPISALTVYPPNTPVKLVPRILPTKSQVKINLYVLTQLFTEFDKTCKTRITPTGVTEGERGFEQTKRCYLTEVIPFFKTLKEHFVGVQTSSKKLRNEEIFYQMMTKVDKRILHLKESVETVREIVEEARVVKPLDNALYYACQYTKLSQELLEYVIGTCPKGFNERDNKAPSTPVTRKKQVTFSDKPGTSSSNTQKHEAHQKVQQTNIPVIPSTGVNASTEASGSKPRSNTKKNRILPAKKENMKKVEVHLRTNKSVWTKVNRIDSSISYKRVVINSNSESVCKMCDKCLNSANHEKCVVNILSSVNANPTVKRVLNKGKQIWKPKGKLSDNRLNKTKRVWKETGKLFADIGYQWRPTGKKFTLGKLNCGYQWRPTGKNFALGEMFPLTKLSVKCSTISANQPVPNKNWGTEIPNSTVFNEVYQVILWYLDSGCSKHMTGNRSKLMNFVEKFIGTVRFGNDHFGAIMGYGDYVIGDSVISRVYYVEGLGHNLFSVGQFCDSDLEVAFRKHTCFVRDINGADILKGSRGTNLYTISIDEMMKSSPICLLSKASKSKSWLWHRRLNHLNFGTINDLARKDLVRGLPRLKFEKDHLCSACQLGKSKKFSHRPKSENTNMEVLHTLHMDLCGPMRVQSIKGKIYFLVHRG
ncbi:retrovirus-related pol polyprotein from transposon TNT 1-94 [Tanacetum coccineum]